MGRGRLASMGCAAGSALRRWWSPSPGTRPSGWCCLEGWRSERRHRVPERYPGPSQGVAALTSGVVEFVAVATAGAGTVAAGAVRRVPLATPASPSRPRANPHLARRRIRGPAPLLLEASGVPRQIPRLGKPGSLSRMQESSRSVSDRMAATLGRDHPEGLMPDVLNRTLGHPTSASAPHHRIAKVDKLESFAGTWLPTSAGGAGAYTELLLDHQLLDRRRRRCAACCGRYLPTRRRRAHSSTRRRSISRSRRQFGATGCS